MSGRPQVQQLGEALLLQGPVLNELRWVVAVGVREISRRDGVTPSPGITALRRALAAAIAEVGTEDPPPPPDPVDLTSGCWLTTGQASQLLGCQPRTVRNLVHRLGAQRHGNVWMFEREAVEAELARRKEASA